MKLNFALVTRSCCCAIPDDQPTLVAYYRLVANVHLAREFTTPAPPVFRGDFAIPDAPPKTGIKLGCPKLQSVTI
jgi:hypothetical protein